MSNASENEAVLSAEQLHALQEQVPAGAVFRVVEARKISVPHPYCIGPKHVQVAADKFNGRLTEEAIRAAEAQGARCDTCRERARRGGTMLTYDQHENNLTLMLTIPDDAPSDLNEIPGLGAYLSAIKPQAQALGIQAFAFPKEQQYAKSEK